MTYLKSNLWQSYARAGKAFTFISGYTTIVSSAETDFILMRNPAASGKLIRFKEIIMTLGASSTNQSVFRLYRNPTITAVGTPITVQKVLSTGSQSSIALAYQTPTISARGTLIQAFTTDFSSYDRDQDLGRFMAEGADLLVTVDGSVINIEHNITVTWAEE